MGVVLGYYQNRYYCFMVLCISGSNQEWLYNMLYYAKIKESLIHKACSDINQKGIFSVSTSSPNIWNISDSDYKEEETLNV